MPPANHRIEIVDGTGLQVPVSRVRFPPTAAVPLRDGVPTVVKGCAGVKSTVTSAPVPRRATDTWTLRVPEAFVQVAPAASEVSPGGVDDEGVDAARGSAVRGR